MADVKICDRCGTIMNPVSIAQKFGFASWRHSVFDRTSSFRTQYDCDLCEECGTKLKKFLDGYGLVDISDRKEVE